MTDDAKNLLRECLQYLYESAPAEVYDRITAHLAAPAPEQVNDGWNYDRPKQDNGDCRKFVTLKNGAMRWTGVRAWHHQGQYWMNNGEPCKDEIVVAWRDLHEPATGFWDRGKLHIPGIKERQ